MEEAQESCKISVIIATRNRAEALKNISLPSLLKQTFKDFEVIVWDASDNEDSAEVVKRFPELEIRYFKAPRVGSCSQRNDAVKEARGEIVYFIDDDSEISPDALEAIYEAMSKGEIVGCSPPEKKINPPRSQKFKGLQKFLNKIFFLGGEGRFRRILPSGRNEWPEVDFPGFVEWLNGGSMAFQKGVFANHQFEEEFEKFGGFAVAEDVLFSYQLFKEGKKLKILERGSFSHYSAPGGRESKQNRASSQLFNFYLLWKKTIHPSNRISVFPFILSVIGTLLKGFRDLLSERDFSRLKGIFLGLGAIFKKEFGNYKKRKVPWE
jgi:glycosyltransferase involved in cell wall biosynthesis